MRKFGILLCCTLFALAASQPGYKYQNPPPIPLRQNFGAPLRPQSNSGIVSVTPSHSLGHFNVGGGIVPASASLQQNFLQPPLSQSLPLPLTQTLPPLASSPQDSYFPPQPSLSESASSQTSFQTNYPQQQQTIITKDIYIHSAPDDLVESPTNNQYENLPIRKNYRIVFIKAPSQNLNLASAAFRRAQPYQEEKTVIYVLSKKPDLSEVQQQLAQVNTEQKSHKPEVYFIKYRTQEEAQRAQQEIQAQYDALGGSTHISDEGVAPIHSVIGSTSGGLNQGSSSSGSFGSASSQQQSIVQQTNFQQSGSSNSFAKVPSNTYLPTRTIK